MIKYIGSKRVLVPRLVELIGGMPGVRTAIDLFSGTARVGHALKKAGLQVVANDHNQYAYTLARCYVAADRERWIRPAELLLEELKRVRPRAGYFTETFCIRSRYFHPKNGERIDAIRETIARKNLEPDLEAIVLVALMEAADRVDSTAGVQMAYLKDWAARAAKELELRLPTILPGQGTASCMDAMEAASKYEADVAYLDPPYNQHRYLGNYHVWETLVRWDKPEVYGIACKRVDCKDYKSQYNSRRTIHQALRDLVQAIRAKYLVVSFSNEGYVTREEMVSILETRGHLEIIEVDFKRYVGAQIGIYNPQGKKVGRVSHLRNTEYVFVVSPEAGIRPASDRVLPEDERVSRAEMQ